MEPIQAFFGIDWKTFCITLFTALVGFQVIVQLLNWFLFDFLGIETKAMREKKEEHKLLSCIFIYLFHCINKTNK